MANDFDLDSSEPPDDPDDLLVWRLWHQSNRSRGERPVLLVDGDYSEAELQQAAELLGQPVQRRP